MEEIFHFGSKVDSGIAIAPFTLMATLVEAHPQQVSLAMQLGCLLSDIHSDTGQLQGTGVIVSWAFYKSSERLASLRTNTCVIIIHACMNY